MSQSGGPTTALEALREVPLFADLPAAALEQLARGSLPRSYGKGQILCNQGDPGETLYILEGGQLRVTQWTPTGDEAVLAVIDAPAAVGELSLLDNAPRSATLTAATPISVRLVTRTNFLALLRDQPALVPALLGTLAQVIRNANARHVDLLTLDVPGRLAKWLLARSDRHGVEIAEGIAVELGRSQGELAAELGTTRSTLNRALASFADLKLVTVDGERIVLTDLDGLRAFTA